MIDEQTITNILKKYYISLKKFLDGNKDNELKVEIGGGKTFKKRWKNLDFKNLFLLHSISILYFLVIISIGILTSVIFNEKMKAIILMIIIPFAMFFINSISLMSTDLEFLGSFSMFTYSKY